MAMPLALRRFTVAEYHRMGQAGIFHDDDRVELIDGQIVEMSPIGPDHPSCVNRLTALFAPVAGRVIVSVQNPVTIPDHNEPQPDISVLRYRSDYYRARLPEPPDVLLLIEVGDTTVERDRRDKVPLYAKAGVLEVWLVDLPADAIEIYRQPGPTGYGSVRTIRRGETLTALQFPDLALHAEDILG